ncbi:hypothetical protein KAURM247S_01896 [Kitasatospora aureofaciens]
MFSRHGLDVPLDQIAKEAGVGNATLYRNFPTREALVAEVFADAGAGLAAAGQEALAAEDAWTGLERYFERIFELVAADRGINDLVTRAIPTVPGMTEISRGRRHRRRRLIARAQAEVHAVRRGHHGPALPARLVCRALPPPPPSCAHFWRRYLALLLDGFRAEDYLLPVPPAARQATGMSPTCGRRRRREAELPGASWASGTRTGAPGAASEPRQLAGCRGRRAALLGRGAVWVRRRALEKAVRSSGKAGWPMTSTGCGTLVATRAGSWSVSADPTAGGRGGARDA